MFRGSCDSHIEQRVGSLTVENAGERGRQARAEFSSDRSGDMLYMEVHTHVITLKIGALANYHTPSTHRMR